ncbi:MAG TPA: class I SAM-dependent methyltransferase, partial [Vicinamibacteria bacterium]|nr:class I SAM-dependent methyltransferase [Vicinamibacteria bacterium]
MGLFSTIVERISDHPVLFILVRRVLENDFKSIRSTIRRHLQTTDVSTLDLGCGPGAFSDLFEGGDYVGADLNARYIDHARRTRKGVFLQADARHLDLPDARFQQV